jgi:MFS family permease
MQLFKENRNLLIILLIIIVNMLGYGIIIPIQYTYGQAFGLNDFQNGLLFALFSVCQFASTPIIGRLSDKYGRRPLLILSITGTALSFFMMAFAPSALWLFIARALDGITAGNIPVALGVIADSTEAKDRPRAFGFIGAAFGLGFVIGPAIAGLTVGFDPKIPFIIAGFITFAAVLLTALFLPETNKHLGEVRKGKLFDFGQMWHALFAPGIGTTFLITLFYYLSFACAIIYGFQPFSTKVLGMSLQQISLLFVLYGVVGLVMQTVLIGPILKRFDIKRAFTGALLFSAISLILMFFTRSVPMYVLLSIVLGASNALVNTLIITIVSKEADAKSQGTIQGLNTSYQSLGMIFGPLLGGVVATISIAFPLIVGGLLSFVCLFLSLKVFKSGLKKESAF